MTTQLRIDQLQFERQDEIILQQINVALHASEILQIWGANGSGKSTLLRIIAGFIEPHAGSIQWRNQSIFCQLDTYQQQLRYLGHQNGVKPSLTVYENLCLYSALTASRINSRILNQVLDHMNLQSLSQTPTRYLSAGQLRRLSLAKLLLNPAPLWILDEPLTALDSEGQDFFKAALLNHLSTEGIAIIATHHLDLTLSTQTLHLGTLSSHV
ncbi:MAG: cytochrome c biosis protein CcmA [Gammaproteobacteria bacterium]|jgi:heme exporter protein A|nr:cytochrome c biosis protein CcmA [Gammaproteobacteria bacterium]